nr:hypothetical protein [Tanacetum cinerariifolium]
QKATDIMQALKESKKTNRRQPGTRGSNKGPGVSSRVPDESTVVSATSHKGSGTKVRVPNEEKVTSKEKVILEFDEDEEKKDDIDDDKSIDLEIKDDEETDDEFVQGIEQVNDAEDEEVTNAEVEESGNGDAEISDAAKADAKKTKEVKDDANKAELPPTSSSLSISLGFSDQILKLSSESKKSASEILKIKREQSEKKKIPKYMIKSTDKATLKEYDQKSDLYQTMHENKSFNKNPANHALYHALMKALIEDENAMDKGVANRVKNHKRQHDDDDHDDEDPSAGPNQVEKTKRRRTKESDSSKKPSTTKETPKGKASSKGSKTGKSASAKEPVKEPIAEVAIDDAVNTAGEDWFVLMINHKILQNPRHTRLRIKIDELDWKNPEGDRYHFNLSKPLLLQGCPGHLIVVVDYLFNNDLEYLKTSDPEKTYTTSITKTKAARYEIVGIEVMVPTLWSTIKHAYDKDAAKGIKHWGERHKLCVKKLHGYGHLEEVVLKRVDRQLYKFKEVKVTLLTLLWLFTFLEIEFKELYTPSYKPPGVIYEDLTKQKRVMRADELYKFSDGKLKKVLDNIHHRILDFHLGYNDEMSRKKWTAIDKKRSELMVELIDNQNRRGLPRDIPLERIEVLRYDTKEVKVRNGKIKTKTELTLEQTQQGVSDEALNIRVMPKSIHSDDGNPFRANIKQALRPHPRVAAIGKPSVTAGLYKFTWCKKGILGRPEQLFIRVIRAVLTFVSTSWRHPWDPVLKVILKRASVMANTTPLVTTVTKPTINPAEANSAPRVNIQEFCEEHYEDILPIIMEKVRHDRRKDVHTRLDFGKALEKEDSPRGRGHTRTLSASRDDRHKDRECLRDNRESIDGFKDLRAAFLAYFMQQKKYVKDHVQIHNIKQRDGETIKDFMERFKIETGRMKGAPECMRISGFMHGVNNPELTKRLNEHVPKTMEEMMITTTAFIRGEAAAASKKKGHASRKPQDQSKRHFSDKRSDFRGHPRGKGSLTDLLLSPRRRKKSCLPKQLKKQIKELVRAEKLSHLIKEIKQGRDQAKTGKKETTAKDKPMAIYMVQSWKRTVKQKVTQSFERVRGIAFPQLTASNGTEGPLVIEAEMGGHVIHRMYIDGGSSMEILYEHCFNRLRPEIKSQMVLATTSMTGFSGETIWPLGQLRLLVTIGDATHSTKAWMNFMVVKSMSPYNVEGGIATISSTILIPTECASVPTSSVTPEEERTRPANFTVALHPDFPDQEVVIGGSLSDKGRTELCSVLKKNLDIFAWQPSDMTGVPRSVAEYRLNIREGYTPVRQKKRGQAPERARAIQAKVQKLVDAGIMREVYYHNWLSNPVMVKKYDGSWQMCVDFTDLNRAYAYKGYHQIQLVEADEEKIGFHTGQGVYCYTKMPFGLKNAGATYQRLMDKAFESQVGRNIEVYVDDLVVKSHTEAEMVRDIEETFRTLRKVNMKLNPKKCSFGVYVDDLVVKSHTEAEMVRDIEETFRTLRKVNMKLNPKPCSFGLAEGVFLGYVITPEGIKPCPDKTAAVLQLPSPQTVKESDLCWTAEAEQAFQQLKQHLSDLPLLVAPNPQEELIMYLSATYGAVSAVLMTERGTTQTPIYFISRALQGPELNYSPMEKLVLSLVFAAKRPRRYFQAHPITVITDQPIKQATSRKLPRRQQLKKNQPWTLFTDGSSCVDGSGAGLVLTNPEGVEFTYALRFQFAASNNKAEYEALVVGLRIAT